MKVILLEKVVNLGTVGDEVDVKSGYARNYLLPQKKAVPANKANRDIFEGKRADHEKAEQERTAAAQALADKIKEIGTVEIGATSGNEGRLFGSVSAKDIALVLAAQDVNVPKADIRLPEGLIRTIGDYVAVIRLHGDVEDVEIKVSVFAS